jgi:Flp pilus assembly protein TadG
MIRRDDRGQSTVEFALALPLLVMMLLIGVQVAVVIRDQVAVITAAREGARAVIVADGNTSVADDAVARSVRLTASRRTVDVVLGDDVATVKVVYRVKTDVPLVGFFFPDITVRGNATMALEK